jgi:hypothetical protein
MHHELICHSENPASIACSVCVDWAWAGPGRLRCEWRIAAMIDHLAVPPVEPAQRRDELWQTTCAEIFLGEAGVAEYIEFNCSPSTCWAAYYFSDFRRDMAALPLSAEPAVRSAAAPDLLTIAAEISLPERWAGAPLIGGFTAIVQERSGQKSYWALHHPPGAADFHHRSGFAVELGQGL